MTLTSLTKEANYYLRVLTAAPGRGYTQREFPDVTFARLESAISACVKMQDEYDEDDPTSVSKIYVIDHSGVPVWTVGSREMKQRSLSVA